MILARIPPSPRLLSRAVVSSGFPPGRRRGGGDCPRLRLAALLGAAALLAVALSGCVGGGLRSDPSGAAGEDFAVLGKLAVRGAADSFSARFSWQQTADRFSLELWGPFGQGRRRLRGTRDELVVLNGAGEVLAEGSSRQVLERAVGFALPLQSLRFWIQGLADPTLPARAVVRDPGSRALRSFEQAGWAVQVTERLDGAGPQSAQVPQAPLALEVGRPKKIIANGQGFEIRLVLNRWGVPDAASDR